MGKETELTTKPVSNKDSVTSELKEIRITHPQDIVLPPLYSQDERLNFSGPGSDVVSHQCR